MRVGRLMAGSAGRVGGGVGGGGGGVGRGGFVLFEGVDRCGKTTQVQRLVETLRAEGREVLPMRFPDRTTGVGTMIDAYLKEATQLDDRAVHLLFAANRWEKVSALVDALERGVTVVMDRYSYSGVAFSGAKEHLSVEWCLGCEEGLPRPDVLLFLELRGEEAAARGGFGEERYEKAEFQAKVRRVYEQLEEKDREAAFEWTKIDASGSIEQVAERVRKAAQPALEAKGPIKALWHGKEVDASKIKERA